MKKILFLLTAFCLGASCGRAQTGGDTQAEMKLDTLTHNFGTFPESSPVVTCKFNFTNTGKSPLVIHQAIASCGCTVPEYPKEPIMPGKTGMITVTYDGSDKYPGYFKKSITLRTNGKTELIRLYIEGTMTGKEEEKKP